MSPTGMAQRSGRSCSEWSYGRLITGGSQTTDTMIAETIGPLIKRARSLGAQHWSFTRDTEAEESVLHVQLFGPKMLAGLLTTVGLDSDTGNWSQGDPFNGARDYAATNELDELSADLTLWAISSYPQVGTLRALGALLLHDGARSLISGAGAPTDLRRTICSWSQFWDYRQSCYPDTPVDSAYSVNGLHRELSSLRQDPVTTLWRTRWRLCLDRSLSRARAQDVPHTPQRLTLLHTNLVLNRIGLDQYDEAQLGPTARLLSDDLIHYAFA